MNRILHSRRAINRWQSYSYSGPRNLRLRLSTSSHRQSHEILEQPQWQNRDIKDDQGGRLNIRERLRLWEQQNTEKGTLDIFANTPPKGVIQNPLLSDVFDGRIIDSYEELGVDENASSYFEAGELVDFGDTRHFLLKGDMVDLSVVNSVQPEFAIFVRDLDGCAQYYTMTGRWATSRSKTLFCVPRFCDPEELDRLLPYLPQSVSMSEEDKLQSFKGALPREVGAPLVRDMLNFWQETQEARSRFGDRLRDAHKIMASDNVLRYCTLEEVANKLLPQTVTKLPNGKFPPPVLYAVHMALMDDASGFRPQKGAEHRYGTRYEVNPRIQELIILKVSEWVRDFQEDQVSGGRSHDLPLSRFIRKAQRLIDESRKNRELTKLGTVGPFKLAPSQERSSAVSLLQQESNVQQEKEKFSKTDIYIIRFIEYWAALTSFSHQSLAHGIGSQILRATSRYPDFDLTHAIGWTFLQEIGVIPPWQSRAVFDLRLPNFGYQLSEKEYFSKNPLENSNDLLLKDRMEALRRDWGPMPVYCIDDISAHEIDDGVSLEKIPDSRDEYWVHIHTADPASHIEPSSEIAKSAQHMASSVYLTERMISMIPREITLDRFSLADNRPSLTFSARMDNDGKILETKVTPGYVRNVKFVTPAVVEEIVSGRRLAKDEGIVYTVGEFKSSESSNPTVGREMLTQNDFTSEDKENLQILHSLGLARRQKAIEKGALPPAAAKSIGIASPAISIQWNEDNLHPLDSAFHYKSDPVIKFKTSFADDSEHQKTTTNLMLLAGEISASWCHERNIPVVYRVTPWTPKSANLSEYTRKTLLPALAETGQLTSEQTVEYLDMLGFVKPSTTPGPHLGLGVSIFARCTSPLRRYSDILLHWQVQSALLEEAKTGQSLVGSTRDDYLPFTKQDIDEIIPGLEGRERYISKSQKFSGKIFASQFVLRAWKYQESSVPLPKTFECQVTTILNSSLGKLLALKIPFLLINDGRCQLPDWLKAKDVKVGDVFECEFEDVDIYAGHTYVKILRRV